MRFDDDDPYLVVAADKGTATFSDIANGISLDYGHWLGDAFASGGSAGYDHKGMGITARGAWESVKRQFLELGKDCQSEPFTAIGIGDMSGDVFGNGMLLSPQTRLIAAFDHRHIFIDPDPDPALSFAERQRLFALPRSSWDDYDRSRLSAGGGVYPRSAEVDQAVAGGAQGARRRGRGAHAAGADPRGPLAPVELFWNGGIGTYVKAASERHADAFDRANDAVRVDAEQLRCRIIGEGGNLGLTQRARIAFAQKGGRINTDFIDNSAGVDCSDHEVNIKILLGAVVDAGDMTIKQRDQLLAQMTDEVAELVLRNNILQVQAISLAEARPSELLDSQAGFMRRLEAQRPAQPRARGAARRGDAEPAPPGGPGPVPARGRGAARLRQDGALRRAAGLRPAGRSLPAAGPDQVLPAAAAQALPAQIAQHRLRREITATLVANSLVNRGLGEFLGELGDQTGRSAASIARAYVIARDAFALVLAVRRARGARRRRRRALPEHAAGAARQAIMRGTEWFLRNTPSPIDIRATVERFTPGIASLLENLELVLPEGELARFGQAAEQHRERGIEPGLARRLAGLPYLFPACEVIAVADQTGTAVVTAGGTYFALDAQLHLGRLRGLLERAGPRNHWERVALAGLYEDLVEEHRRLTIQAFASARVQPHVDDGSEPLQGAVLELADPRRCGLHPLAAPALRARRASPSTDLAMLAVAVRALGTLDAVHDEAA